MENGNRFVVIGIGNPYRGDDAAGLCIAQQLMDKVPEGVSVLVNFGEISELLDLMKDAKTVILLDAVKSGSETGRIFRFDATEQKMPVEYFRFSTHAFSIPEAIELARVLGQLPSKVIVYGVEGKGFEIGDPLSPEVESAVIEVVGQVISELV